MRTAEMLVVAEKNRVRFLTELGIIEISAGEIAVVPRGLKVSRRIA
ncbi:MAG: homogentisate 1,2-dioxygenase [Pyrinomonadaceae bacterium]